MDGYMLKSSPTLLFKGGSCALEFFPILLFKGEHFVFRRFSNFSIQRMGFVKVEKLTSPFEKGD